MSAFCSKCPKSNTCKEICKPLENYLQSTRSDKELLGIDRLYSDRWIKTKEQAIAMIEAGAARIGTSSGVTIVS